MSEEDTERLGGQAAKDKLVGRAKEIVGGVVGSESMAAKGRLQQAEGEAKDEALRHKTEAEVQQLQAREAARAAAQDAAQQRTEASQEQLEREAQLEDERSQAYAAADRAVAGREAAVEQNARKKESLLEVRERLAEGDREEALEVVQELETEAARSEDNARELERLQQDGQ